MIQIAPGRPATSLAPDGLVPSCRLMRLRSGAAVGFGCRIVAAELPGSGGAVDNGRFPSCTWCGTAAAIDLSTKNVRTVMKAMSNIWMKGVSLEATNVWQTEKSGRPRRSNRAQEA